MKARPMKTLKSVTSFLLLFLITVLSYAQDNEYNLDETYSIEQNGTIHLISDDAEVEITGSDRSDVHLVVYRRVDVDGWRIKSEGSFKMEVENRGGDLYIREADTDEHRVILGNVSEEYRITIEAPRNVALDLQGDDETYRISDIHQGVHLSADDADIELDGVKGDEFNFDIDDGSIRMSEGRGRLKLQMDDGELYVRKAEFNEIDADFDDGEVDITTALAADGFYLFDMDDGDIELNVAGGGGEFDIHHDNPNIRAGDNFEEVSADEDRTVYRLPGGNARIEIDSDDGDIELRTI